MAEIDAVLLFGSILSHKPHDIVMSCLVTECRIDVDDTLYPVSSGFSDHRNGEAKPLLPWLGVAR